MTGGLLVVRFSRQMTEQDTDLLSVFGDTYRPFFVDQQLWQSSCAEISMDNEDKTKQQVAEAAKRFFEEYMSIKPESIVVDIHSDCIVATMHNAISKAEKAYTRVKLSSNLLDRFYKDTFDASKNFFETAINEVFPKRITGSFMSVHPESGRCVVVMSICDATAQKTISN
jgi:uncharacterized protein YbcI